MVGYKEILIKQMKTVKSSTYESLSKGSELKCLIERLLTLVCAINVENAGDLSSEDKYTAKKHWNLMFKNALPM